MNAKVNIITFIATIALIAGAAMVFLTKSAHAKPEFAAQTHRPCAACHVNPAGGGKLKPLGEAFKANGFKLPKGK